MVDQDLELYGRQRAEWEGFVLLALPAFHPYVISFFNQNKGAGEAGRRGAGSGPSL